MHSGLGRSILAALALIGMTWGATSAVAAGKKPAKPSAKSTDDKDKDSATFETSTVDLGEPAAQIRTGGGGRFLIFHLKKAEKLAIVDVTKSAVVHSIEVPDDVRFAASQDKLLVVAPAQKLVHRYSLTDFQREKTAALPDDSPAFVAVMGCSSNGPLVLRGQQGHDYSSGKLWFWDIEKMAMAALPHDLIGGGEIRISADGRSLTGWTTGISGQTFELARLTGDRAEKLRSPDAHTYNQWWATPTADGSYVLRYDAGIYSKDLKPIASDAFSGRVLMPCEDPRLMLAARIVDRGSSSDVAIVTLNDQQVLYTLRTGELKSKSHLRTAQGYFGGEPRARFLPALKAFVTFPESNDRVVVRKFDLAEALKGRGGNYLFVVSKPPPEAKVGETFTYRPQVLTNGKTVKFKLESGPEGMVVADDGQITWPIKQRPDSGAVKVVVSVSTDNGKETFHSFSVALASSASSHAVAGNSDLPPIRVAAKPAAPAPQPLSPAPTAPALPAVAPLVSVRPAPVPAAPAKATAAAEPNVPKQTIVELGEPAAQVCTGGGGRFLIFHLKRAKTLAIVDVTKSAIVHSIEVPDDVRYAASLDKLLVVAPGQNMIHRYSLANFQREKTASLPADVPVALAVMGCSSHGPLALRGPQGNDYSSGKLRFWDIDKMEPSSLPPDVVRGGPLRVSADGQSFLGWTAGLSGQQFELTRLVGADAERVVCPDGLFRNQFPSADGRYVVCDSGMLYTRRMQAIRADPFQQYFMLPCEDPRLFLAVGSSAAGQPAEIMIVTLCDQQVLYRARGIELFADNVSFRGEPGYFNGEPRAHFFPSLKALVTFPERNDRVVIRQLDLSEAIKQSGNDYLFAVSQPPDEAKVGEKFRYQTAVLTNGKETKFRLESGPVGAQISAGGVVTWQIKSQPIGGVARFVISISSDNGKEAFHSFDVFVAQNQAAIAATSPPVSHSPANTSEPAAPAPAGKSPVHITDAAHPEAGELVSIGKFRLAGARSDLRVIAGIDGQSLLVLQQNRLCILGPDGITIRKQVTLPKRYTHLAEREKYYVALAAEPRSIDLIDKASLTVTKTFKLSGMGATDLALHPTKPIAYVAYNAAIEVPGFRFITYNEESGDGRESERSIGKWLNVSPDGTFLIAAYSDLYVRGQQLVVNPDSMFFVPEYGNIDWLIRYDLSDPERPIPVEKKEKAGGNGGGLRMSPDGKRVTYLSHVGFPEFSGNLGGWDPTDLHKLPVTYGTKDVGTTLELAYHPVLPLVASFSKTTAVIFDREQGDLLTDRVKLSDDDQLTGNIRRVYFTPDGRHLLFEAVVNGIHYLVQAELKLTAAELKQVTTPRVPPKHVPRAKTA